MTRRTFLKLTGAAALFSSGLPGAMHAKEAQKEDIRIPALLYHEIAFEHDDYTISPSSFSTQMERLYENGYRTLAINEAAKFLKSGGTGPATILTFDDGYASFMDYAFPLLKEYGFKALVNIIGHAVDNHSLLDAHRPVLSWDECRYLRESGLVELGCHSYALHTPSARSASYQTIEHDLMLFQEKYKKELGTRCSVIAWPYGTYDRKCIEIAHQAGFTYLFTSNEGYIDKGSAASELPRLNINDKLDLTSFEQYIGAKV